MSTDLWLSGFWELNFIQSNRQLQDEGTRMSSENTVHAVKLHFSIKVGFLFHFGTFDLPESNLLECFSNMSLWPASASLCADRISLWAKYHLVFLIFFSQWRFSFSFFLYTWYSVLRKMDVRTQWKHNVAGNMQVEYTAEQKVTFPNVFFIFISSFSWNIICHSDLHLQARDSFFECGLFPSRASISVMVWGVIWDKIWKRRNTAISLRMRSCMRACLSSVAFWFKQLRFSTTGKSSDEEEKRNNILPGGHPSSRWAGLY